MNDWSGQSGRAIAWTGANQALVVISLNLDQTISGLRNLETIQFEYLGSIISALEVGVLQ